MSFADTYTRSRRLFLLRLLVEYGESANESVLKSSARDGGFGKSSAADIKGDLDHLFTHGCIREEWHGALRVVTLTDRGEDIAYGRAQAEGIEHSIWRRQD